MTGDAGIIDPHVAEGVAANRELALRRQGTLEGPRLAHDEQADRPAQRVHEDLLCLRLRSHGRILAEWYQRRKPHGRRGTSLSWLTWALEP